MRKLQAILSDIITMIEAAHAANELNGDELFKVKEELKFFLAVNASPKVGERVFALMDQEGHKFRLFGFGVYEGDHPCPKMGGMGNPRIKLDDGKTVWGCECWWGPEIAWNVKLEEARKKIIEPIIVENVDIDEMRKLAEEEAKAEA